MPDKKRPETRTPPAKYRDYASTLHEEAGRAHSPETRQTLEDVARCYEILADHVERRRNRTPRQAGADQAPG